ncbi:MAG: VCBS domain-containing protein [Sphingopyxis sp.]|nr:VCBS domain-containing protein [Sphingopyxis sp.]
MARAIPPGATTIVPVNGIVQLPPGTRLDAIKLSGNDLLVTLPDGQVLVIVDGALRIPQIKIGPINIPPPTVAALIAGQEPEPAAGRPQSSGGNFAQTPGDIGDPFGLGDLLPPTEFGFVRTLDVEVIPDALDDKPSVLITTPDQMVGVTAATAIVSEAALAARGAEPAGTDPASPRGSTSGTIQIAALDQPVVVAVNGTAVTAVGQVIATPLGEIVITSIAPDLIDYVYTLTDNSTDPAATDIVTITVTDSDGDVGTATLTLTIEDDAPIARADVDDTEPDSRLPQAGNVITGDGTVSGADGADSPGADGAVITGIRGESASDFSPTGTAVQGEYGRLVIAPDGTYAYIRSAGTPGGVSDVFTYQLTDGDGDVSTATLTIRISDSTPSLLLPAAGDDGTFVHEAGLPERDGESPGSRDGDDSNFTFGVIQFAAGDGPAALTINGVALTEEGQAIELATGTFYVVAINPDSIEYFFWLTDNTSGDNMSQLITVGITDLDGDTVSASFEIDIIDDVPEAVADFDGIPAGTFGPATGNVITDGENDGGLDFLGADGASVSSISGAGDPVAAGTPVAGLYGILTLNSNGSYSYVRNPGTPGGVFDTFTYQLTDGDGDTATATLQIAIGNSGVTLQLPNGDDNGQFVSEAGLPAGSAPGSGSATTEGLITFAATDGVDAVRINGEAVTAVGQTIAGDFGTLTVTSITATSIGYSYTLIDATNGDDVTDNFGVVVTDLGGDTASGSLSIVVEDDVPTANDDLEWLQAGSTATADGNVLTGVGGNDANAADGETDVAGADGASVTAIAFGGDSGEINGLTFGAYGTLAIAPDGSYVYTLDPENPDVLGLDSDDELTETFDYVITDSDGDEAAATLTVVIRGRDDIVTINGLNPDGAETTVAEANLADGSNPNSDALIQTGEFSFDAIDGIAAITIAGETLFDGAIVAGLVITTDIGVLTITDFAPVFDAAGDIVGGTISYSYELSDNSVLHAGPTDAALTESFAIEITDSDGSVATASLDVLIVDDVPVAQSEPSITVAEDAAPISGNLLANDTLGADGAAVTSVTVGSTVIAIAATGTTTYANANGTYSFQANGAWSFDPVAQISVFPIHANFTYTITDGDGDQSSAVQLIRLADGTLPTASDPIQLTVDDQHLESGSTPSPMQPVSSTGNIVFTPGSDAIASISFGDISTLDGGLSWTLETDNQIIGWDANDNPVVVIDLSLSGNVAAVTVTLQHNYGLHPDATIDDLAELGFIEVVATDADGDQIAGAVNIAVSDDVPSITALSPPAGLLTVDETNLAQDATANFASLFNILIGADQDGSTVSYAFEVTTASGLVDVATGSKIVLQAAGNIVEGRLQDSPSTVAFRLTVANDGQATLDQIRAVRHPDASNPDDPVTLSPFLIRMIATVTDSDGDQASALVAIGSMLVFKDDGPSIDAANVDTNAITLTTQDGDTRGSAFDVATADLSSAFSTSLVQFGADGPAGAGAVAWTYSLMLGSAAATSALTSNGVPVTLALVSGEIVGSAAGTPIFSIAVDAATGVVTLTQFAEIDHPLPGSPSNYAAQLVELAPNLVELRGTATIVDRDGDSISDTVAVDLGGNIRFADDGPSITAGGTASTLTVDESDFASNATVNLSGLFTATTDFGADGPATIAYELGVSAGASGLIDALTGEAVILSIEGGVVFGRTSAHEVFRISVAPGGLVTFDQSRAVLHTPDSGLDQTLFLSGSNLITLTAIATDGDGDTAQATADITGHFAIRDDAPEAVNDDDNVARDGQNFADGNVLTGIGGSDDNGVDGSPDNGGADGGLLVIGMAFGATTGAAGSALTGDHGSITIAADGSYRYDLDPDDPAVVALNANETLTDTFQYTVRDADGDTSVATITISITGANDFPIARADTNWVIEGPSGSDPSATGNVLQDIAHPGAPSGSFADIADNDPDLEAITVTSAGTYVGLYGTLVIAADGGYTYTLDEDKPVVNALDSGETLIEGFAYTVSDGSLSVSSMLTITVFGTNDAPTIGTAIARVSEEGLPNGLPDAAPSATLDTTNSATFSGTLAIGDADVGETLIATLGDPGAVLTAAGVPVAWSGAGTGTLIGSVGSSEVIRVTLASTGAYTVTLSRAVDQPTVALEDLKDFFVPVSVSDGTTTTTNASAIQVVIEDDAPTATGETGATSQPAQDVNTLFILDFSDSIDDGELDTMLEAVQGALAQLDSAASGALTIKFVIFSSGSFASESFSTAADANAYLDTLNPLAGGERPSEDDIGLNTNYSGAIQTALANFTTIPGASNQVFFLSDGNPNQQTQFGGIPPMVINSLTSATATAWNNFVDNHNVNVTAIGIDNNPLQPLNIQRLRDVDLNNAPNNEPILVDDFEDLVATLLSVIVPSAVSGDLDANDFFGADGGRLQSITIGTATYSWDGGSSIAVSSGGSIAGTTLNAITTPMGGTLTLDFATGQYSYQPPSPITVTATEVFNYVVTDRDGDTASANLSVTITALAPPIAVDLDGDGVEFVSNAAGVHFDYNSDGVAESTAWVGADDGLLAIDKNGDGKVNNGAELVFGGAGMSDLQGLAATYDGNGDGKLDAADAEFAKFGIWQDANSNGVTDAGEFRSLISQGIISIALTSDGHAYTAADGQVQVKGEAFYTRTDGSTGKLADAAFATNFADQQRIAATSGTAGLSTAMLVAGLAAATPLAARPPAAPDGDATVSAQQPGISSEAAEYSAPLPAAKADGLVHEYFSGPATAKIEADPTQRQMDEDERREAHSDEFDSAAPDQSYAQLLAGTEVDLPREPATTTASGDQMQMVLPPQAVPDLADAPLETIVAAALEGPQVELDALLGPAAPEEHGLARIMLGDGGSIGLLGDGGSGASAHSFIADLAQQHVVVQLEQMASAGHA